MKLQELSGRKFIVPIATLFSEVFIEAHRKNSKMCLKRALTSKPFIAFVMM